MDGSPSKEVVTPLKFFTTKLIMHILSPAQISRIDAYINTSKQTNTSTIHNNNMSTRACKAIFICLHGRQGEVSNTIAQNPKSTNQLTKEKLITLSPV